jgi:hypothetical protein
MTYVAYRTICPSSDKRGAGMGRDNSVDNVDDCVRERENIARDAVIDERKVIANQSSSLANHAICPMCKGLVAKVGPQLWNKKEVAYLLNTGIASVNKWIKNGDLKYRWLLGAHGGIRRVFDEIQIWSFICRQAPEAEQLERLISEGDDVARIIKKKQLMLSVRTAAARQHGFKQWAARRKEQREDHDKA